MLTHVCRGRILKDSHFQPQAKTHVDLNQFFFVEQIKPSLENGVRLDAQPARTPTVPRKQSPEPTEPRAVAPVDGIVINKAAPSASSADKTNAVPAQTRANGTRSPPVSLLHLPNTNHGLSNGQASSESKNTVARPLLSTPRTDDEVLAPPPPAARDMSPASPVPPANSLPNGFEPAKTTGPERQDNKVVEEVAPKDSKRDRDVTTKAQDAASSPTSSTQTVTTPIIHDVSAETSPEKEPPVVSRDHEVSVTPIQSGEVADVTGDAKDNQQVDVVEEPRSSPPPLHGVEQQLLQESAAARRAKVGSEPSPKKSSAVSPQNPIAAEGANSEAVVAGPGLPHDVAPESDTAGVAPAAPPPMKPFVAEIRDSQESSPIDDMNVDETSQVKSASAILAPSTQDPVPKSLDSEAAQASSSMRPDEPPPAPINDNNSAEVGKVASDEDVAMQSCVGPSVSHEEDADSQQQIVQLPSKPRDKTKVRAPTVVFGKSQKTTIDSEVVSRRSKLDEFMDQDYFTPLFVQAFGQQSKWMKHIDQLVHHAHKTIGTPDLQTALLDNQSCKILKRVYHLQQHNKWTSRQLKRLPEPTRPPSHWDILLQEMKWMRTDFREERKWKRAVARNLAIDCAQWIAATPEERKALQVQVTLPRPAAPTAEHEMLDEGSRPADLDHAAIPDLVPSSDDKSPFDEDEPIEDGWQDTVAPSAIFALQDNEVVFSLTKSPTSDQLLEELPWYGAPLKVLNVDFDGPEYDPDANWRRPALALNKFVEGQVVFTNEGPPRKRSRFSYGNEEDDDGGNETFAEASSPGTQHGKGELAPEDDSVALFKPEMKQIRDRLHAGHQFRPPSEHPMPLQNFFETRYASQWLWSEDDELRSLVREYSYNWSLISSMLSTKSMLSSGAERRTPWECFERWVHLEGMPTDMAKTQYFRTYTTRQKQAEIAVNERHEKLQQAANASGAVTPIPRRRSTTTMKVERRRNQKHLALIDAMRKLAKKREGALQKQQQAASHAANRKNEPPPTKPGPTRTPKDYSLMRYERDQQLAEKMAQYAARQQEAQRRVGRLKPQNGDASANPSQQILQSRGQAQMPAAVAAAAAAHHPQVVAQLAAANAQVNTPGRTNVANPLALPGQPRPRMQMPAQANGVANGQPHAGSGLVHPMPMPNMTQAQLQQAMQAVQQQRGMAMPGQMPSTPDMNLVLQARRIQDQQRATLQLQQQANQQHGQQQQVTPQTHGQQSPSLPQATPGTHGSPNGMRPAINGINQQGYMANNQAQVMMAAFNNQAGSPGMATPPGPGLNMPSGMAGSPRAHGVITTNPSAAVLQHLQIQIRAKHPGLPEEQVRQLAMDSFSRMVMAQRATTSAAGGSPQQGMINGSGTPQMYAQHLRAQQQAQAAAAQQPHQRQPSAGAATGSK